MPPKKRFFRQNQVRERYGEISYTTLWRRVKSGDIPKPVKLGKQNIWDEAMLDARDAERALVTAR